MKQPYTYTENGIKHKYNTIFRDEDGKLCRKCNNCTRYFRVSQKRQTTCSDKCLKEHNEKRLEELTYNENE